MAVNVAVTRRDDVVRLSTLQQVILERLAAFVRPVGRLIYATCSVLRHAFRSHQ